MRMQKASWARGGEGWTSSLWESRYLCQPQIEEIFGLKAKGAFKVFSLSAEVITDLPVRSNSHYE
jgi:hypothetical protein